MRKRIEEKYVYFAFFLLMMLGVHINGISHTAPQSIGMASEGYGLEGYEGEPYAAPDAPVPGMPGSDNGGIDTAIKGNSRLSPLNRQVNSPAAIPKQNIEPERASYIVELRGEPVAKRLEGVSHNSARGRPVPLGMMQALHTRELEIRDEQEQALADIGNRLASLNSGRAGNTYQVRSTGFGLMPDSRFSKVFNGFVFSGISSDDINVIKESPYVKNVYQNKRFNITLDDSIPIINADDVWALDENGNNCQDTGNKCLDGEGVKVALIDTGIDFTHPNLGGCFGNGCKVAGGYDFVNEEDIPIDEVGHGTHVAGIIAGRKNYSYIISALPAEPILYYSFDNDISSDSSQYNISNIFHGGVFQVDEGVGKSVDLNGEDSSIEIPEPESQLLNLSNKSFTITFWARTNDLSSLEFMFFKGSNDGDLKANTFGLWNSHYTGMSSGPFFEFGIPNTLGSKSSLTYYDPFNNTGWHFFAVVANRSANSFGYSMDLICSISSKFNISYSKDGGDNRRFTLGAERVDAAEYRLNGGLDEFMVYDRALSGSEISAVYYNQSYYLRNASGENPLYAILPKLRGGVNGVAPNATLYSYKVCDWSGCTWDDILSGIERAVDPNQDGDFSDRADIISMSLGGTGDPDDPISTAVDNAVDTGAVVVVAAGNEGPLNRTIDSPGTARKAITVAASTKDDGIADFSSRGPVAWNGKLLLKPDIAAPGDNILSSVPGNGWDYLSGTSMATPMVSGAVALLRQANPSWTPRQIKLALRAGALPINGTVTDRGYGRLDLLRTLMQNESPPVLDFAIDRDDTDEMSFIGNVSGESVKNYSLVIGKGTDPDEWWFFCGGSGEVTGNGRICPDKYDSFDREDGAYSFRLAAETFDGNVYEERQLLNIEHINLSYPLNYDVFRKGDLIEIQGHIEGLNRSVAGYKSYALKWKRLYDSADWSASGIHLTERSDGILGTFNTSFAGDDGFYAIGISVEYDDRTESENITHLYLDHTIKEGWPRHMAYGNNSYFSGAMISAVHDLNNDGIPETIVAQGIYGANPYVSIIALEPDSSILWERKIGEEYTEGISFGSSTYSYPLVSDINNDGKYEVVTFLNGIEGDSIIGLLYALDSNGTVIEGYPLKMPAGYTPQVTAVDVDNDSRKEIIIRNQYSVSSGEYHMPTLTIADSTRVKSYVTDHRENPVYGSSGLYPAPLIANLDDDPELEILVQTYNSSTDDFNSLEINNSITGYNLDGTRVAGWNKRMDMSSANGDPSLGVISDFNSDKLEEILIAKTNSEIGTSLHAFHRNGTEMPGFNFSLPVKYFTGYDVDGRYLINSTVYRYLAAPIAVADINHDSETEIALAVWGSYVTGYEVFLLHENGTVFEGWPKTIPYYNIYGLVLSDINNDSLMEVIITSGHYTAPSQDTMSGVFAWDLNGNVVSGFPKQTEYYLMGPVVVADMDGDGLKEIIGTSVLDYDWQGREYKLRNTMYVWETGSPVNLAIEEWPYYMHDSGYTACYGCSKLKTEFDGSMTTDISESESNEIRNMVIDKRDSGAIQFSDTINITRLRVNPDMLLANIVVEPARISINTSTLPELNISAELTFRGIHMDNPLVYLDGRICGSDVCSSYAYDREAMIARVTVSHFSDFTLIDSPVLPGNISINVTDASGIQLSQIEVYLNSARANATFSETAVSIDGLGEGVYSLGIRKSGYSDWSNSSVVVRQGQVAHVNAILTLIGQQSAGAGNGVGGGGGGGGGGASLSRKICTPDWACTEWSACINTYSSRNCTDRNKCGGEGPEILKKCAAQPKASVRPQESLTETAINKTSENIWKNASLENESKAEARLESSVKERTLFDRVLSTLVSQLHNIVISFVLLICLIVTGILIRLGSRDKFE